MFSRLKKCISNITPYVFTKSNAWAIGKGIVLTSIGMGLDYLAPYLFSEAIVALASETVTTTMIGIEFSPMGLIATSGVVAWGRQLTSNYTNDVLAPIGPRATESLIINYVEKTLKESPSSRKGSDAGSRNFHLQNTFRMGEVASNFCTQIVPTALRIVVGGTLLSTNYGTEIGLGMTGAVICYTAYNIATKKMVSDARDIVQAAGNENYQDVCRALTYTETSQIFNTEDKETKKIKDSLDRVITADIKSNLVMNKVARGQDFLVNLSQTALCLMAGNLVLKRKLSPQDFIFITTYLTQFFGPLSAFGSAVNQCASGVFALETVFNHLEVSHPIPDIFPDKKLDLKEMKEIKIEFKEVSFQYVDKNLFDKISFTAKQGEKIGIVGTSGAGKSTIGKLLFRFYDVSSGEILINGTNIKSVGLDSLRSTIGIIQQEPVIFNESIFKNIEYGGIAKNILVTRDEIKTAAEKAHLDFIDDLDDGLDTLIGETGITLSGGQKQRVAIARALLKKPTILISDEATASLDPKSEYEVQSNIDNIIKDENMIGLVITHKLTNVVNADKILVFDKGEIVEVGTHAELLEKKGCYHMLWQKFISESSVQTNESKEIIAKSYKNIGLFSHENKISNTQDKIEIVIESEQSQSMKSMSSP